MKKIKYILLASMVLILSACSLPGLGSSESADEQIVLVSQVTTESQIMAHVVAQMIEHYIDTEVDQITNMGSAPMMHQAIMSGDANIAGAFYTGTALTGELGREPESDPDKALELVREGFREEFDMKWLPSYGFANTYAFMVTQEIADEYGFEKISDVAEYADELVAGVDTTWLSRKGDGYEGFVTEYDFEFGTVYPMQIGLVYDAVESGEMDIVLGYSTDGRISSYDLVVLEDDLNFFPPYDASPVPTYEILETHPELENILLKLHEAIDVELMQRMNYIADDLMIEPTRVAEEFLKENNYFEEKAPYVEPIGKGGQS
ncbi:osmoprotectant ABC transporter substrate-binding protein [Dolosigranulum savutiense]|uniref:Osmoprotectant ABC transporter substrate-binding protein n=1 Tax=Dolosigranulum savutiense TaxID=3110288 RepID=A0AB74TRW8_9LACT